MIVIQFAVLSLLIAVSQSNLSNRMESSTQQHDDTTSILSQPVDMKSWESLQSIRGRAATEEDMKSGSAVFYVGDNQSRPFDIKLPVCGIIIDDDTHEKIPVVCIQAEQTEKGVLVGYRLLEGGTGICDIGEIEFLSGPDERFTR
jgi:hypothetical protein